MQMQKNKKFGVTLIELVLVLVVMSILAATFILRNNDDGIIVMNAAERFTSDIRYMRSLAISESRPYGIVVEISQPGNIVSYSLYRRDPVSGNKSTYNDPTHKGRVFFRKDFGVEIGALYLTPNMEIWFNNEGVPYGDISFSSANLVDKELWMTIEKGNSARKLAIEPNGEIKNEKYP